MIKLFCFSVSLLALVICLPACGDPKKQPKREERLYSEADKKAVKDQFVKANQQLMQKENDEMDNYAKMHKMAFIRTGSGIRYFVYKASEKGDSITPGMQVNMDFVLSLLDGTECYNSKREGRKTLVIAQEEAESGIHKGLQYLKRGDKAILLIPSPLAHGLLGDFKKIPPQMPIVYEVQVY